MTSCVRCGAVLSGNTVLSSNTALPIVPPRAGRWEKRLQVASLLRAFNLFGEQIVTLRRWLYIDAITGVAFRTCNVATAQMFLWAAIPGLPQLKLGRPRAAEVFFCIWLTLLIATLLTIGTSVSLITMGLLISCHFSSLLDVVWTHTDGRSDRIALLSVMVIGAILLFYTPTAPIAWSWLGVQEVNISVGPLQPGDRLLYRSRWWLRFTTPPAPQLGDLVLYTAPTVQYNTGGGYGDYAGYGGNAVNRLAGTMFDRVVAVAGQRVTWSGGKLTVDGVVPAATVRPLVRAYGRQVPDGEVVVPEGHSYIVPSAALQRLRVPEESPTWFRLGLVPNGSIFGDVWGIRRGLFRFVTTQETPMPAGENAAGI